MSEKVFLSYSAKDRVFAESIKSRIKDLLSLDDADTDILDVQSCIAPGEDYRGAIKAAIDAAGTVVIIASPNGDNSQWVNYEAGLADALGKDMVLVGRQGVKQSALAGRFLDSARLVELD